ncbi:AAA-like domain-containing protein [Desulfobacterales bacterium HSG2]|nr:AAA-like domain-containing protein [Desulfobacterales bacterium HSG2]
MRKFSSYGPVNTKLHYYAPRKELVNNACVQLVGEIPEEGGHYITVWAPRQTGKTWVMQQVVKKIRERGDFEIAIISMQSAKSETTAEGVLEVLTRKLWKWFDRKTEEGILEVLARKLWKRFGRRLPETDSWKNLAELFTRKHFEKPLILILDEFDALREDFINQFANEFRDMYISRRNEEEKPSGKKSCILHGLALIGVRSVLGIENVSGSPFNTQRSVHIPNLTCDEVNDMFAWYQGESGQKIGQDVVERLFYETRGQPGLTSWFGELITEGFEDYKPETGRPVDADDFEEVFAAAVNVLPNNNILNIISKAKQEPYNEMILDMFRTDKKIKFGFDDPDTGFLYMNGVIDREKVSRTENYVRFSSPFVQKRLFNYFAHDLFGYMGRVHEPFEDMSDTFVQDGLNIRSLMRRFEAHLKKNREWLLKDAPRRKDLKIFEAVWHFNLYSYLCDFLGTKYAQVWPEFPTGNGEVDLVIRYEGHVYALELKSYTDERGYREALGQAARYGRQLRLSEVSLVFFVEYIDDANREKYERDHTDEESGVLVMPMFVDTGN